MNSLNLLLQRILSKIKEIDDCWIWTDAPRNRLNPYGRIKISGKVRPIHRVVYKLFVDDIPKGLVLDHLCRNTMCVNPKHLEPVTIAENTRRGNSAKLDIQKAAKIRRLYKKGLTQKEIAIKYKIDQSMVSYILSHKNWRIS